MALRSSLPPCKKECKFITSFQFCPQAVEVPLLSSTSCATLKVIDDNGDGDDDGDGNGDDDGDDNGDDDGEDYDN